MADSPDTVAAFPSRRSCSPLKHKVERVSFYAMPRAVVAKPKHSMLPILIVLFLISYGLLAKLVVEQGRTIDSQRSLIRQLFGDSSQLSAMNGKSAQAQHAAGQVQNPKAKSQAQTPS